MTDEDTESFHSLQEMCSTASLKPIPDTPATPVTVSTVRSENVSSVSTIKPSNTISQPANIFDLNNLLILALQIEDQIKFNESELLE